MPGRQTESLARTGTISLGHARSLGGSWLANLYDSIAYCQMTPVV